MIIGAGLAGLIAAYAFPGHDILEAKKNTGENHKALLRFRGTAVADLTGIEFKPVTVHKGIWMDGQWREPRINLANMYSLKVLGKVIDRSIWNLSDVTRWIAPTNFYERILAHSYQRIQWGADFSFTEKSGLVISTAPLSISSQSVEGPAIKFEKSKIVVARFTIPDCDVYQTVYFPTAQHALYRASITGNLLICEFKDFPDGDWMGDVKAAFGIPQFDEIGQVSQEFGKIAPIDEDHRQHLISKLTKERNVFSLGRFATWRNILLDDVVHDISVIKRLITANDYRRTLFTGERK